MSMQISIGDDRDDDEARLGGRDVDVDDDDDRDRNDSRSSRRSSKSVDQESDTGRGDADEDGDDDTEPEDGWEAEVRRLRAALKKSNSTGQRRRQQLKDLRAAQNAISETDDDSDDEVEEKPKQAQVLDAKAVQRMIEKARKEERKTAEEQHRKDLLATRAEAALVSAGVSEKNVRLLKGEIDFDDFELDSADEIDRLRVEFPEFFKRGRSDRRRINGGDDRDSGKRRRPLSATEQQVAQLERGRR